MTGLASGTTPSPRPAHRVERVVHFQRLRRHATALKAMFASELGYALIVESSFARLVKAPLPASAPVRPARRATDDSPFTAATYVHLALACAAQLAPGVGEQILISALVDQIRAMASRSSNCLRSASSA